MGIATVNHPVIATGPTAHRVTATDTWQHVAGLPVGQDISEGILQMATTPPQFSLGKSFPGLGQVGPWLVTLDELDDPDDLELDRAINGETPAGIELGRNPSHWLAPGDKLTTYIEGIGETRHRFVSSALPGPKGRS